jgi:hypothetical protein
MVIGPAAFDLLKLPDDDAGGDRNMAGHRFTLRLKAEAGGTLLVGRHAEK